MNSWKILPLFSLPKLFLLGALLCGIVGCGSKYKVAPVSGRVTLDGEPLADAYVTFQPVNEEEKSKKINLGPGSFGKTDGEGRYTLQLVDPDKPGAVVGMHKVTFTTQDQNTNDVNDAGLPIGERIPREYREEGVRFEVPRGGTEEADFNIETKK